MVMKFFKELIGQSEVQALPIPPVEPPPEITVTKPTTVTGEVNVGKIKLQIHMRDGVIKTGELVGSAQFNEEQQKVTGRVVTNKVESISPEIRVKLFTPYIEQDGAVETALVLREPVKISILDFTDHFVKVEVPIEFKTKV